MFLTPLGAAPQHPLRAHRAKALAEEAVGAAAMATTTFALLADLRARASRGRGCSPAGPRARVQPICAADVASCLLAVLDRPAAGHERHELAGPHELSWRGFAALAAGGRVLALPPPALRPALRAYEALTGPAALLTLGRGRARRREHDDARAGRPTRTRSAWRRARRRDVLGASDALGQRRPLRRPRPRGLELRGDLEQRVLPERVADQLDGRRQAVLAEPDRDRDRRLPRDVEQRGERRERRRAARGPRAGRRRSRGARRSAAAARPGPGVSSRS